MDLNGLPLVFAVVGLLVGPLLYALPHRRSWDDFLDSFTLASVGGLCFFHLLPEAIDHGGPLSVGVLVLGAVLPRLLSALEGLSPWLLLGGLVLHAFFESAAMAGGNSGLGMAVVLHRVPVGLAIFAMYHEHPRTAGRGWLAIAALVLATSVGFFAGPMVETIVGWSGLLEAGVAGMLLHVVWERGHGHGHDHGHAHDNHGHAHDNHGHDHGHGHDHEHGRGHDHGHAHHHDHAHGPECGDGCGHGLVHEPHHHHGVGGAGVLLATLFGLAVVLFVVTTDSHDHGGQSVLETSVGLLLETAPALVIAYVLAGLLHGLVFAGTAQWMGRGGAPAQALKGVLFGLPLPICSCGVLPMYETLVRRGVPATAAMGFLIATPELGLDALLISLPLLGPSMAGARLVAAFVVAIVVALAVGSMVPAGGDIPAEDGPRAPLGTRLREGLRFGLVELVDHTLPWVLVGLLIAAFAQPLLELGAFSSLPPMAQVLLFALLGVPVYVCASGATPVAAVAIAAGVSPGAALAFLIAGPATNVTTFGVLRQLHSTRVAVAFGAFVVVGAVVCGWLVDALPFITSAGASDLHVHGPTLLQQLALGGLALLLLGSLWRQGPRGMVSQIMEPIHAH